MKLFTRTVCPKCVLVKTMMSEAKVDFDVVNIDNDEDARNELKEQGFMSVPVLFKDGNYYADIPSIQQIVSEVSNS